MAARPKVSSKVPLNAVKSAAAALGAAWQSGIPSNPVRNLLPEGDIEAAYAVQDMMTKSAVAAGRRLIGRKIGLTSLAVQMQLGVEQPDFGMLFADMLVGEGLPIPKSRLMQPKIEAEIALILDRDIKMEHPTLADVVRATAYALPALEIVGSRIANWDIKIVDTVADNASSGLFVLGGPARKLDGLDLHGATMEMLNGGDVVSKGTGAACLGHPLNAAAWLAAEMVRRGRPLLAGDVVLTGALGPMVPVKPGDTFRATIAGVGTVTAVFA
jgi:2-keto-4-pentenoate hydratase